MGDAREDDVESFLTAALASGDGGMARLISSLPLETMCQPLFPLRQVGGFWLPEMIVLGAAAVHAHFEPRPDDIFLASFPKSGTTWLKALAFAVLNRAEHPPSDPRHPLRLQSPHDCVRFLELPFAVAEASGSGGKDLFAQLSSPRVLATHDPPVLQPPAEADHGATAGSSSCRVVYVARDPKDVLVSAWLFFTKKNQEAAAATENPSPYPLEEVFELFCNGRCVGGPQWLHVLGFWEESRRRPDMVLFLTYEEMLRDPASNVRRLAEFMGCPFSAEEEGACMVDAIVELCSLDSLKRSAGNGSGVTTSLLRVKSDSFFWKGVAGDWRNHLTAEMAARLDGIVASALQGSGLSFGVTAADESISS